MWVLTESRKQSDRPRPAGEGEKEETLLSSEVPSGPGGKTVAGRRTEICRCTYSSGWHDTNNCSEWTQVFFSRGKTIPCFSFSVHICSDIGSRSVKPSQMMEERCLWRRASKGERAREGGRESANECSGQSWMSRDI